MSRLQKAPADGDSIMVYQPWRFSVRQELAIFIVEIGLSHHGVTAKKRSQLNGGFQSDKPMDLGFQILRQSQLQPLILGPRFKQQTQISARRNIQFSWYRNPSLNHTMFDDDGDHDDHHNAAADDYSVYANIYI